MYPYHQRPRRYARYDRAKTIDVIMLGILVHVMMLSAVFEIYFSSPIVQGMNETKSTETPPAERLVVIVADGLRADSLYDNVHQYPYLSDLKATRSSWGYSHTRVPTESRPGHVAIFGGIYEDPSAILLGWQANPVDFDSVINQSTNAYCFGSPDIMNAFSNIRDENVEFHSYDANMEDFGNSNTSILDLWVFDEIESFLLTKEAQCEDKKCALYEKGNLFFLHLLGIDTAGHGFKPHSKEYLANIRIVDEYMNYTELLFEKIFPGHSTAYVFTADHGMTSWGSHGAGTDAETITPIIVWGPGIKINPEAMYINQIDIATLLSSLIGINFPLNNLGKLPYQVFDMETDTVQTMMVNNAKQLAQMYKVKRDWIKTTTFYYLPYFDGDETFDLHATFTYFNDLIQKREDQLFFEEIDTFMDLMIGGCDYFHNYYRVPLLISITLGFLLWILYLCLIVLSTNTDPGTNKFSLDVITAIVFEIVMTSVWLQSLPSTYYLYMAFPVVMSYIILNKRQSIREALDVIQTIDQYTFCTGFLWLLVGIELLVLMFFYRTCFNLVLMHVTIWIWYSFKYSLDKKLKTTWITVGMLAAMFPFLDLMAMQFNIYAYLSGIVFYFLIMRMVITRFPFPVVDCKQMFLWMYYSSMLAPAFVILVEFGWIEPDSNLKYASWIISVFPFLFLFRTTTLLSSRLTAIFMTFAPYYMLVSVNFEFLFLGVYICLLYLWLIIESRFSRVAAMHYLAFDIGRGSENSNLDEFRRGYFFVAFIFMGFFGTGNLASLNSFDPMWVRCFLTIFSPFKMAGLILLKILVPFVYTACVFRAIHRIYSGTPLRRFCVVLVFSDLMLLHFLFNVTNVGSWLEIGLSLSHFVVMLLFIINILTIYGVAYWLTTTEKRIWFFQGYF